MCWGAVCGGATNHTTWAPEAAEADGFYDEHYTKDGARDEGATWAWSGRLVYARGRRWTRP
jgi:hypothetical protein